MMYRTLTVIRRQTGLVCPFCCNPKSKLPLPKFVNSRSLMTHIGRTHDVSKKNNDEIGKIPYEQVRDVRRLSRVFQKSQHESFLMWITERGYSF